MDDVLIVGIVALAVFTVAMACVFAKIIGYKKMIGAYIFRYGEHEISVGVAKRRLTLRIDGTVVAERRVLNVYVCTLRSALEGVKIHAEVDGRLGRMLVGVTADGVSLPLERRAEL